jgi:hypothetical protein
MEVGAVLDREMMLGSYLSQGARPLLLSSSPPPSGRTSGDCIRVNARGPKATVPGVVAFPAGRSWMVSTAKFIDRAKKLRQRFGRKLLLSNRRSHTTALADAGADADPGQMPVASARRPTRSDRGRQHSCA